MRIVASGDANETTRSETKTFITGYRGHLKIEALLQGHLHILMSLDYDSVSSFLLRSGYKLQVE